MPQPPQAEQLRVIAVGAVVVDGADRILLVRRARPPTMGAWTLPGGRVEKGESFEAAIVREVREETGVDARVVCPLGMVPIERDGFVYAIHEYLLAPLDDAAPLRAGDDASDARWTAREQMDSLGVWPDVIDVIDRALAKVASGRGAR